MIAVTALEKQKISKQHSLVPELAAASCQLAC